MRRVTFFIPILVLAACVESSPQTASVDSTAEREVIMDTDRAFSRRSEEVGSAQAFAEFLTHDALMLPHGANPVTGSDSIQELMTAGPEYSLVWEPRNADVAASGDLGWSWGEYTATSVSNDGQTTISYGKYVSIWRKQEDGSWKAIVDIGNQSPAPVN